MKPLVEAILRRVLSDCMGHGQHCARVFTAALRERFVALGADALLMSIAEFEALNKEEMSANAEIIKAAGIKPEEGGTRCQVLAVTSKPLVDKGRRPHIL